MDRIQMAKSNMEKFFGRGAAPLEKTDPEFAAIRDRLIHAARSATACACW